MKVTIITACYNRSGTIRNAIESVLAQTYPDIEYIVVDGGSTDGTRAIINEYRDRISKVIFKPDHGMYEGINNGIREATGELIALCHSDDQLYDSHTVEMVVKEFKKHPEADMVYANGIYVNSDSGKIVRVWKSERVKLWRLKCGWLPLHTTCYVRREVYERYGLYDETYRIAADTKFLLNILYTHKIKSAFLPRFVVQMQMGGASTDVHRQWDMWKEDIRVFNEIGFRCPIAMKMMKMLWKPSQFLRGKLIGGTK